MLGLRVRRSWVRQRKKILVSTWMKRILCCFLWSLCWVVAGCSDASVGETTGANMTATSDVSVEPTDIQPDGISQEAMDAASHAVSDIDDKQLPYITDIQEWVDLSHLFSDAGEEQKEDAGPDEALSDISELSDAADVAEHVDATLEAIEDGQDEEVSSADDAGAADAMDEDVPSIFNDCEELGIANHWAGTFEGEIAYELTAADGINLIPEGILPVNGDLAFDIECIDSKLAVSGAMDGVGTVEAQGEFPFAIKLAGYYSPQTGELTAKIVEGVVSIYDLVEVYFEGEFEGSLLADNTFSGIWIGVYLGSNLGEQITGEATGLGTWVASEAVE
jgi:hypothetical protein